MPPLSRWRPRVIVPLTLAVALLSRGVPAQSPAEPPSPHQFFGFSMGAERRLAGWDRIVEYFKVIDRGSDRVVVQELGKTTMGRPYIMAIVSSPDTIASLPKYQEMQRRLADPAATSEEEAARIAREGKVVLLIGTNVHATEIGNSQMVNDLIHKLATERSPWVDHILRNVVLLLIPSENPDGQQMVVDWYHQNLGTPYEDSPLPELYHKYAGHDNNRDSYMLTQVETQHLNRVTYKDWLPEVYLDKHQMGSGRARIFVPPFKNPPNPNVDPLVWSEVNMLGQAMAARLHEAGKTGVVWGEQYTGYWQGANSTNPWWHNMVALLTEVASARGATTVVQQRADADRPRAAAGLRADASARQAPAATEVGTAERDPGAPLPPPTDVQYRMNYPQPWMGGPWRLADVVEYQFLSTLGLLEGVANNRELLKRNFYVMNRRAIELYRTGSPFAYLVPPAQRDPIAAAKLLQLVQAGAAGVHRADAPFTADGEPYPAGTHVILLAQPFGRWVKDLLEPQKYPDIRAHPSAPLERPYDVTAWTLGQLMGVRTVRVDHPFEARLARITDDVQPPAGRVGGTGRAYVLDHGVNNSFVAMNRLLRQGAEVAWARDDVVVEGVRRPAGAIFVTGVRPEPMAALARELHLQVSATDTLPERALPIRAPRIALYEPWGGNMDAGWTRWLLEQHEFPYARIRPGDVREANLRARYDAILLPEMTASQILNGLQGRHVRPDLKGGIGLEGVKRLREFAREGGTIVTLGNTAQFAIEQLGVPFENALQGVDQDSFFCPGSLLRVAIDTRHPIGFGMPDEAEAMFIQNGAYVPAASLAPHTASVVARYPQGPLLRSGWIIGESRLNGTGAVVEAVIGQGRVIMLTFRVQNRAQTWGTFRLLFNALFYGPAIAGRGVTDSLEADK